MSIPGREAGVAATHVVNANPLREGDLLVLLLQTGAAMHCTFGGAVRGGEAGVSTNEVTKASLVEAKVPPNERISTNGWPTP